MPCFSVTTASISPVNLSPPAIVALLGILLGELSGKLTGTGDTASVAGCVTPGVGVLGPFVGVLNKYYSESDDTARVSITAVPGESIKELFGGANKSPPGDSAAIIFRSVASVLDAMVEFFKIMDGRVGASTAFGLICNGARTVLTDLLSRFFVFYLLNKIKATTIKAIGLILPGITWS